MTNLKRELVQKIQKSGKVQESIDWFMNKLLNSFKKIDGKYLNDVSNQTNFVMKISKISPAACYIFGVSKVATTGIEAQMDYKKAIMFYEYGNALAKNMNPPP